LVLPFRLKESLIQHTFFQKTENWWLFLDFSFWAMLNVSEFYLLKFFKFLIFWELN
jgi:hypothetical protein